mmetsp:Transcript_59264/g.191585  ORF Transcript_59264/g.191585 Transcript_59264/m.191585 type:complete len:125 (+) Transcript_59264:28-402(+)
MSECRPTHTTLAVRHRRAASRSPTPTDRSEEEAAAAAPRCPGGNAFCKVDSSVYSSPDLEWDVSSSASSSRPRNTVVEATLQSGQGMLRVSISVEHFLQKRWRQVSHMSHSGSVPLQIQHSLFS